MGVGEDVTARISAGFDHSTIESQPVISVSGNTFIELKVQISAWSTLNCTSAACVRYLVKLFSIT